MKQKNIYLKQNVMIEPLFDQWYVWPYLISPAAAAMYVTNSHLKIMKSFVSTPQVHISALKNPAMLGGPFINYGIDKVEEIKSLLEKTTKERFYMVELAEAIKNLDHVLINQATGYSLESVYKSVPECLKGFVELVYDLNNYPSVRFIEALLYNSPCYDESAQSISLSIIEDDNRSFVFSTPRLKTNTQIHLQIPFKYGGLDELFKMKAVPRTYSYIKDILNVEEGEDKLFESFFTEDPPQSFPKYEEDKVRVRYFGHACILIETKNVTVLTDPVISYKHNSGIPRYTFADLPEDIDYVLITHNHQDHCMFETLLQLRHKIKNLIVPKNNGGSLVDPSLKLILQNTGFENVIEIDEMESIKVNDGFILGLPFLGEHADLNIKTKMAYLVNLKGKSTMLVADSNNIEPKLYEHIHKVIGDIDVLFIGMECDGAPMSWLYGSLMTKSLPRKVDQSRRFDGSDHQKGMALLHQFNPKKVYVYAMGQEPWLTFLTSIRYTDESRPIIESNKLVEDCRSHNIDSERLFGFKEIFLN